MNTNDASLWVGMPKEYQRQAMYKQNNRYDNHPRENVSWYQAVAFTRWMTEKYRAAGLIESDVEIRLPTEQEWDYVAQCIENREYPYGEKFDATKGNTYETGIGQSSAVGIFPEGASHEGVMDMIGNVWEWCANDYNNPHILNGYGNGKQKVVRGWAASFRFNVGAVYRDSRVASNVSNSCGFRVVLSSIITVIAR